MERWYQVAALSVGGVLGVNARYWLGVVINRWAGVQFPWATFAINVSGSFAIGLLSVLLARWLPHPHARLLVVVGFLGATRRFRRSRSSRWRSGSGASGGSVLAYMGGSVAAGFAAVVLGTALGRELTVPRAERAVTTEQAALPGIDRTRRLDHDSDRGPASFDPRRRQRTATTANAFTKRSSRRRGR